MFISDLKTNYMNFKHENMTCFLKIQVKQFDFREFSTS